MNLNYLNQKELCQRLCISPNTAKKEIAKAMNNGCNAVIKIGKSYRINYDMFILWINKRSREEKNREESINNRNREEDKKESINNKNKKENIINNQRIKKEVREQWERETLKTCQDAAMAFTTSTTMTKRENASALQLRQILNI
jgi:hypothetical protein